MRVSGTIWLGVALMTGVARASDLTIHLNGDEAVKRVTVKYQCDAQGTKMGLPSGVFSVDYLNGTANHLVVVPVKGRLDDLRKPCPRVQGAKYARKMNLRGGKPEDAEPHFIGLSRAKSFFLVPHR